MNRKFAWLVTPLLLASVHLVEAQQTDRIYRIGFLSGSFPGPSLGMRVKSRADQNRTLIRKFNYF
jgi:hypothetical protein